MAVWFYGQKCLRNCQMSIISPFKITRLGEMLLKYFKAHLPGSVSAKVNV